MKITQQLIKDLFDYRDGELYWKISVSNVKIGAKAGSLNCGYLQTRIKRKAYRNHRIIFLYHHGYLPQFIDHIDGNKLNNSINNLREATLAQNNYNAKKPVSNTSGFKNISWCKNSKKWKVYLHFNNKSKHFGYYHDIDVAKFIAETMRYKYHGQFANHGEIR